MITYGEEFTFTNNDYANYNTSLYSFVYWQYFILLTFMTLTFNHHLLICVASAWHVVDKVPITS